MNTKQALAIANLIAAGWARKFNSIDTLHKTHGHWMVSVEIDFLDDSEMFIPIARIDFSPDSYVAYAGDREDLKDIVVTVDSVAQMVVAAAGKMHERTS